MSKSPNPQPVGKARAELGEGPVWDRESATLYWVDIFGEAIHCYRPADGEEGHLAIGRQPGCVVLAEGGGLVVAAESEVIGLGRDGAGDPSKPIASVKREPRLRFNDGKCDPRGRLWVGTMDRQESEPLGALYRITREGGAVPMQDGITVSNGLGWSPGGETMYYIDSPRRRVWAYDFDLAKGSLADRRTLLKFEESDGYPDGMTVDAEGGLWVAFWDGGKVVCFDPKNGRSREQIDLPASKATSCAFGGQDLDQLFITSARVGLADDEEPLAGRLFVCQPGVTGLPSSRFEGN